MLSPSSPAEGVSVPRAGADAGSGVAGPGAGTVQGLWAALRRGAHESGCIWGSRAELKAPAASCGSPRVRLTALPFAGEGPLVRRAAAVKGEGGYNQTAGGPCHGERERSSFLPQTRAFSNVAYIL